MGENTDDKIMFQYVMSYKAYRIRMVFTRGLIGLVVAGGLAVFAIKSIMLGILLPVIALFLCSIAIIAGFGNEQSYTVYADRVVLRKRGAYKRTTVPISAVTRVAYKRALYEKQFATGTVTLYAKINGKTKKYKMRNIFDARPAVEYIEQQIANENKG